MPKVHLVASVSSLTSSYTFCRGLSDLKWHLKWMGIHKPAQKLLHLARKAHVAQPADARETRK